MATGARQRDIRRQFLIEALVLALMGGAAGVGLGIAGARVLTGVFGWPMMVSPKTIAVATGVASAAGLIFGFYPAQRAARLDPIEALRSE